MEHPDWQAWFEAHPHYLHWKSPRLHNEAIWEHPAQAPRGRKIWQAQHPKASLALSPMVWTDQASGGWVQHLGPDPATHWGRRCRAWATTTKGRQDARVGSCGSQGTGKPSSWHGVSGQQQPTWQTSVGGLVATSINRHTWSCHRLLCPKQVPQPPPHCFGISGFCPDAQT